MHNHRRHGLKGQRCWPSSPVRQRFCYKRVNPCLDFLRVTVEDASGLVDPCMVPALMQCLLKIQREVTFLTFVYFPATPFCFVTCIAIRLEKQREMPAMLRSTSFEVLIARAVTFTLVWD